MKNIITSVLYLLAMTVHVAIKLFSKYLDYKQKQGHTEQSISITFESMASLVQSKNTVSLGAAMFFLLVLIAGMLTKFGTRSVRLFFLMPLHITAMIVISPLVIIFLNPKLKQDFLQSFPRPHVKCFRCFCNNSIEPIIN